MKTQLEKGDVVFRLCGARLTTRTTIVALPGDYARTEVGIKLWRKIGPDGRLDSAGGIQSKGVQWRVATPELEAAWEHERLLDAIRSTPRRVWERLGYAQLHAVHAVLESVSNQQPCGQAGETLTEK